MQNRSINAKASERTECWGLSVLPWGLNVLLCFEIMNMDRAQTLKKKKSLNPMWHQQRYKPKPRVCTFYFNEQLLGKQSPQVTSWFSMGYVCGGGGVMVERCQESGSNTGNRMNKSETWVAKQLCWLNNKRWQEACIWASSILSLVTSVFEQVALGLEMANVKRVKIQDA